MLTDEQKERYSRHLLIPEVGIEGQQKLLDAKVLLIGAGGLGSPAALYLAAAGVGTLGIVDDDVVDLTNLQRQVIHNSERIGEPKVESARKTIAALNPDVEVEALPDARSNADNVLDLIREYDVIVDGADNFPTRYLLNDAAVRERKPVVHASILGFDGQLTVFVPYEGPCYRCLYPQPPPADLAPSCGANGVLGVLPGIMGLLQANETIKLIIGRASRWSAGCSCSRRCRPSSRELRCAATPRAARSAATASISRTPSSRTTRRSAPRRLAPAPVVRLRPRCRLVKIPPVLRPSVSGMSEVEVDGDTVGEVLQGARRPLSGHRVTSCSRARASSTAT